MFLRLIAIVLLLSSCAAEAKPTIEATGDEVSGRETYAEWLVNFKQKAVAKGIPAASVDAALANTQVLKKVIRLDRKQPEHKLTLEEYLDNVINDQRIEKGHALLVENRALLNDISKRTGVEPEFIVALWGLESGFGRNF